jgi:hypothetical protein
MFIGMFFVPQVLKAQLKRTQKLEQIWLGYSNQTRFSKRWGMWLDLHYRTKDDFFDGISQTIVRPGISYYVNDVTKLTAGYAYVSIHPLDNKTTVAQPEHRLWQQIQWQTKYKKSRMMQWLRLEERYRGKILNDSTLGKGYSFNFRLRYNFLFQVPLTKKDTKAGGLSFVVNDEVHVNFGKQIVYNYFDQNRFFAGLAYPINASNNIQFGYMNLFQQLAAGNQYRSIHAARIFYFHNLDLRRKDSND